MSLITRCPACETMFKVVPDQLRISDGWVRCGQCDEVFDASANLVQETAALSAQTADAGAHWALAGTGDNAVASAASAALAVGDAAKVAMPASVQSSMPASSAAAQSGQADLPPPPEGSSPTTDVELAPAASAVMPGDLPDRGGRRGADQGIGHGHARSGDARRLTDIAAGRVSFMQAGTVGSIWGRTWVRVSLALSCLILLLGLGAQVVDVERDHIAALEPATRPWLASLCELQGCTISPIQRIESIVIESSSFNKLRGDVYRLNFAVRSSAPIEVGLPAIELTLTDSQDRVLTRRVFQGAELGAKTSVLAPGAEWQGSWGVSVKGTGITDQISGYRMLAFYP